MRLFFLILILYSAIVSCNSVPKEKAEVPLGFIVRNIDLAFDTTIKSVALWRGNLMCLLDNGSIVALDTNYKRLEQLERLVNKRKFQYMFSLGDTLFVANNQFVFYFDTASILQDYSQVKHMYGEKLYEDSNYYVYACCVGEFGGAVFFRNKKSDKFYSYYATCASQVLKFQGQYVVCNNLAHLDGSTDFLFVPNPETLFMLDDEKQRNHCNWYVEVDSLNVDWDKRMKKGTRSYEGPNATMSLMSFVVGDSLYSMLTNDSSTYIAVHRGDTILDRQTILSKNVVFHSTDIVQSGTRQVCLYQQSGGDPFQAIRNPGHSSGLIVVDGNRVDFLHNTSRRN